MKSYDLLAVRGVWADGVVVLATIVGTHSYHSQPKTDMVGGLLMQHPEEGHEMQL